MRPPCARRVAEPSATLRGVARAPAVPRGSFCTGLFCPPLVGICIQGAVNDPGVDVMLRVRKRRSSLLAPALLVEPAAETGTVLRGMNAVARDDCAVVAAAVVRGGVAHWAVGPNSVKSKKLKAIKGSPE